MAGGSRDQRQAVPSPSVSRQYIEADTIPDLYADEFWFASNPIGGTLTLVTSVPPPPGTQGLPKGRIVGRVRMSPQLAVELARIIAEQLKGQVQVISTDPEGPKH